MNEFPHTLRLFTPVTLGTPQFVMDVTDRAIGWRRSIRGLGGYWNGEFTMVDDVQLLAMIFYEYLGYHVIEKSGGYTTFEGLVYEMELNVDGAIRRRTFDMMRNNVSATYTDADNEIQSTAAAEDTASSARHGRRDEVLPINTVTQASAEANRDSYLAEYGWPWARPVGVGPFGSGAQLTVSVAGYVYTANWRYESVGDETTDNLSDWISEIVATDCEFLQAGAINANTIQVVKKHRLPALAFDVIQKLVGMGDASGNPWRFYVDNERRAYYKLIDTTPLYYLRNGKLYASAGGNVEANPWQVKPAIVRDVTYPVKKTELGAWLSDARDFYLKEVEVSADYGLVLKDPDLFDESEILAAQAAYQAQLERESGSNGGGPSRLNWKRKIGLKEGTPEWEQAAGASWSEKQALIQKWKGSKKG